MPIDLFVSDKRDPKTGLRVRAAMPPGPARDRALQQELGVMRDRASDLDRVVDALRDVVLTHDPVVLILSIAMPASMGFASDERVDDAPATTTWDAKIEYLLGVALSAEPGRGEVTERVTAEAVERLGDVYDAANARKYIEAIDQERSDRPAIDDVSFLLTNEALHDRMAGYACHLEQIDAEIFDRHRAFYVERLGFCPSDAVRLVRRHVAETNRRWNESQRAVFDIMNTFDMTNEADRSALMRDEDVADTFHRFHVAMDMPNRWTATLLAETTGVAEGEIAGLLAQLSVRFGAQPEFRTPFDVNVVRTRPLVALDDGTYLAPLPWSVAHNVHAVMQDIAHADSRFATRYQKHRAAGAERLVRDRLASIFGDAHTYAQQHYIGADGPGEIDVLVSGAAAIAAEVKSHALTDPARRGYRPRIERVADDVIETALMQTGRAARYILDEGGRAFAPRQGGTETVRLPEDVETCHELVVTLERMDPLATHSLTLAGRIQPAWVVNVADFLMVVDILHDPVSLLDYIDRRGLAAAAGVEIIMESDALESYLADRLEHIIADASNADDETTIMLGYSSAVINDYFTSIEMGLERARPTLGVPDEVLDALATTYDDTTAWSRAARTVLSTPLGVWKTWRKFTRRHEPGHPFVLPGSTLTLVTDPEIERPSLAESTLRFGKPEDRPTH